MARRRRSVLVTGFEPFDQDSINPSWEAARMLDGWRCADAIVHARQLPCAFGSAIAVLGQAIAELNPQLILCVGLAGGRSDISVERVAINIDDARIADNAGQQPIDTACIAGAPSAYFSSLPIKAVVRDLHAAGIPASVSNSAGTFVCNHLFFGLMHGLATTSAKTAGTRVRGGFVHIPYLPQQTARRDAGQPSMALDTLVQALRIVITTSMSIEIDIKAIGGQLS